jgi:hypothetical protein
VLRQVGTLYAMNTLTDQRPYSYDLDMDTRLAEETATLVKSYVIGTALRS